MEKENAQQNVVVNQSEVFVLNTAMRIHVKTADICSFTGKTKQWIGQLAKDGILNRKRTDWGFMFEVQETMSAYCEMLEARGNPENLTEEELAWEGHRRKAETELKVSKATMAKLEAQEMQGKMHRADDVAEFWDDMGYAIRAVMMAMPGRVAVDMARETGADPAICAEIIKKECYAGLEELQRHRYNAKFYEEKVRGRMNWDNPAALLENENE